MIMIMMLSCRLRGVQKSASASVGYATMMSSNEAKTAVDGCLMLVRVTLVVRKRVVKATPRGWCKVCLLLAFSYNNNNDSEQIMLSYGCCRPDTKDYRHRD